MEKIEESIEARDTRILAALREAKTPKDLVTRNITPSQLTEFIKQHPVFSVTAQNTETGIFDANKLKTELVDGFNVDAEVATLVSEHMEHRTSQLSGPSELEWKIGELPLETHQTVAPVAEVIPPAPAIASSDVLPTDAKTHLAEQQVVAQTQFQQATQVDAAQAAQRQTTQEIIADATKTAKAALKPNMATLLQQHQGDALSPELKTALSALDAKAHRIALQNHREGALATLRNKPKQYYQHPDFRAERQRLIDHAFKDAGIPIGEGAKPEMLALRQSLLDHDVIVETKRYSVIAAPSAWTRFKQTLGIGDAKKPASTSKAVASASAGYFPESTLPDDVMAELEAQHAAIHSSGYDANGRPVNYRQLDRMTDAERMALYESGLSPLGRKLHAWRQSKFVTSIFGTPHPISFDNFPVGDEFIAPQTMEGLIAEQKALRAEAVANHPWNRFMRRLGGQKAPTSTTNEKVAHDMDPTVDATPKQVLTRDGMKITVGAEPMMAKQATASGIGSAKLVAAPEGLVAAAQASTPMHGFTYPSSSTTIPT